MSETSNRPSRGPAGNGRKVADRSVKAPQKASPDDDLNRAIINLLQRDGRMPFSEVAERLSRLAFNGFDRPLILTRRLQKTERATFQTAC